ncbi:hypothetical protein CUT44_19440 [Streptomyces carminius]|uniref:Uncharacterized protein n=1 Tax=Streptomyces carminius TaxID=2665496 RepID=A0A2M8LVJ7_9ACTN|nr:hypothetical protein CUT44_19440 [Streptomyces carminius]
MLRRADPGGLPEPRDRSGRPAGRCDTAGTTDHCRPPSGRAPAGGTVAGNAARITGAGNSMTFEARARRVSGVPPNRWIGGNRKLRCSTEVLPGAG